MHRGRYIRNLHREAPNITWRKRARKTPAEDLLPFRESAIVPVCVRGDLPASGITPEHPSALLYAINRRQRANPKAGALAPNTIGTLYGRDLSFNTVAVTSEHITEGRLPVTLPGSGVSLQIEGRSAFLYYVSPTQINFLVPPTLTAGPADFQLVLDGRAAERIRIELAAASPALFASDPETVVATHLDASVVTSTHPATADEIIVLFATGSEPRVRAKWPVRCQPASHELPVWPSFR